MKKVILFIFIAFIGLAMMEDNQNTSLEMEEELSEEELSEEELSEEELLGKELFFDKISAPDWMSCATCHGPKVGFTGPNPGINVHGAVYRGAVPQRFGNRKPPSIAYATLSPVFHYDDVQGLFVGGNFWDGRATGEVLGNPAADQALGPFLNSVEQNNENEAAVLEQIANSQYAYLWEIVYGEPISYETVDDISTNYNRVGLAIAAYEASPEVNSFSSKFDLALDKFTEEELWGMELFNGKAGCFNCHVSDGPEPLFTDFTFDNIGVPINPENPFYEMDEVFLDDGTPINPLGIDWIDEGLGGFLETRPEWESMAEENMGKHRVPTLRNVDKRPGNGFPKAYMHNGVFKSLKEVVHFYNTRDVEDWPAPEVADNVNEDEVGDLGLTDEEEDAVVAFMGTLTDGYKPSKKKSNALTMEEDNVVGEFKFNIWPTPSTGLIHYNYSIPEETTVRMDVFNMSGNQVSTIAAERQEKGEYRAEFNADHYEKGVYVVRLQAGDRVVVKKMILIQ